MRVSSRLPRLKKRKDFLRIAKDGRSSATPGLVLQCAEQPLIAADERGIMARVGFTASRRVGGAVARNRAKRRLRAAAEIVLSRRAWADRDYVLIARTVTLKRQFADLVRDLDRALMRLGCVEQTSGGKLRSSANKECDR